MNNPAQRVDSHQIRLPLIISFIIGLLFFLPNILIPLLQDNPSADYSPLVATTFAVEETVYAAGIREVFDGHFFVNDPQIYENKDSPSYVAILPNLILGLAAKILGSLPRLYLLCDFLCPAVIFLLVYTLLFKITRQAWVSCLGGVTVLIGYVFIPYIPFFIHKIPKEIIDYQNGLRPLIRFSRLPYSQFSFIILIAAALLTYQALTERKKYLMLLSGFVTGLTFYTYFYHYTFISVAYGIMFLIFFIQRKKDDAFSMFVIISAMVLTAIPYLISYAEFSSLPHVTQIIPRLGIQVKQISIFKIFIIFQVGICIVLGWLIVKEKDRRFYFFISFLLAALVCYWGIPLVLGYGVQIFHWSSTALDPFIIIYLAYLLAAIQESPYTKPWAKKLAQPFIQYQKRLAIGLILFFFAFGFYTHIKFSSKAHDLFYISKALVKSFEWLNHHVEKDAVVMSDSVLTITLLPTYTHCNNFVPCQYLCTSSTDEIIHRLAIAYRIFQVPSEYLEKALSTNNIETDLIKELAKGKKPTLDEVELELWPVAFFGAQFAFGPWNQTSNSLPATNPKPYKFPQEVKEKMKRQFTLYIPHEEREKIKSEVEKHQKEEVSTLLKKYRVDYVFFGPHEKLINQPDFSQYDFLKQVYNQDGIEIYQVRQ